MSPVQTSQQKRAQLAYACVKEIESLPGTKKEAKEDYANLAKKFPALVQACGLAQTIAFVDAKEKKTSYLKHLAKVMSRNESEDLGKVSREAGLMEYQRLSIEAIEAATWLKRYSEALLEKDEKEMDTKKD